MKIIKTSVVLFITTLLMSTTSCQNDKYPDLEEGLYAEFVTSKGTIVTKLFSDKVPVTVANFVALAEGTHPMVSEEFKGKPFYNGLTFHRVMDKFMIQAGDPTASGSGSPGYRFETEFEASLKHDKPGMLSMANAGGTNTNGSQFFITEVPYPSLDTFDKNGNLKNCNQPRISCHTVFGEVVIGLEIQDSISNVEVDRGSKKPIEDVFIKEVNIIRQGFEARKYDALQTWETELPLLDEKRLKREEEARLKAEEATRLVKEQSDKAKAAFIKDNETLKGRVENLPIGITMIFTKEGKGPRPNSTEKALINYAGYFENGELFDTSWKDVAKENGKYNEARDKQNGYAPFAMIYNETANLVPGFRAAMLNMKVGDKVRVFIPSHLGYGASGYGNGYIPPNTNLYFDLELVGIEGK